MSDTTRSYLKNLLATRYAHWVRRFERLAGSKDRAADLLHETWLRLESVQVTSSIENADAYIMRMANNIAIDQHRRDQRFVEQDEIDAVLDMSDEVADPERIVAGRRSVDLLEDVLLELTPRRRAILMAARIEGQLNREIADRFGISLRLVESELRLAIRHCLERADDMGEATRSSTKGRRKF
jgi:RNA polymerase sigma factor (sigma-70 family)